MKVLGVIPARFQSTRFPGKPLALINGKPLLQWVIEGSRSAKTISEIIVATDDKKIFDLALSLNVNAVMTDPNLPSGTDRIWAAAKDRAFDIALNIQGDEPLIRGEILDELVIAMKNNPHIDMCTLGTPFKDQEEVLNPNVVKIVLNSKNEALYFSRFPIPYSREKEFKAQGVNLAHIGLYGYRKEFLREFCATKPSELELHEGLEQLRALWMGAKIYVVPTSYQTRGVDNPEDVILVEKLMKSTT